MISCWQQIEPKTMKTMSSSIARLAACLALGLVQTALVRAADSRLLWEIGKDDHNNAEFALAPGGYSKFSADAFYVVGRSTSQEAWPYVHPGPADSWAGSRPHVFTIVFGVKAAVSEGTCRLVVDLLDTQKNSPPKVHITVNDRAFDKQMPAGAGDESVQGDPSKGKPYHFVIEFPAASLKAGNNAIDIANVAGSWMLYDRVALEVPDAVETAATQAGAVLRSVQAQPMLVERGGKMFQPVLASVVYLGEATEASLRLGTTELERVQLQGGGQEIEALAPAVEEEKEATLELAVGGKALASRAVTLKPVRHWTVYILMHSHVDIGYTDIQPKIAAKQAHNVQRTLELIPQTKDYPSDAQFRWNLEVHWTYEQFWTNATPEQKRAFEQAVHGGHIGLDGMYGNLLTGISRGEELVHQLAFSQELGRRCGVTVDSMMISDVPGLTWGLIPALTQAGVKYISDGPNFIDRIGWTRVTWEDKPFYWLAPNGKDKVLYWAPYFGYAFGHTVDKITDAVQTDLRQLEENGYPYDLVQIRWSKGDNGSADERVMQQVRDWNAKYASPHLVIATTSRMFHDFEQRYAAKIPTFRGDFTPYWEDGAPSSARETALNRHSADRLSQAETLWALRSPTGFPAADFAEAWKAAALYSEHTWGAHNSVSAPDIDFVKTQWRYKQGYALAADTISRAVLAKVVGVASAPQTAGRAEFDVYNTASWPRTDLVTLAKETPGDVVKDPSGKEVPSQRLTSGELVFLAHDVPALGAARYSVEAAEKPAAAGNAHASGVTLTSPRFTVKLDETSGAIVSLRQQGLEAELVDGKLNSYIYLPGSDLKDVKANGPVKITVKETGPLVASLLVTSEAPSCRQLLREVRVIDGLDRVELIDELDKLPVRTPEGLHFGFEFNVPGAAVHMNSPMAVFEPEKDQLPGACKNWFSVERWVDVANAQYGVTWATVDAPLVEMGGLTANLLRSQPNPVAYLKTIKPSSKLYSWVMNNHWHTNYRADQEGKTTFRYALRPHHGYDPIAAAHFGLEASEPLIAAPAAGAPPPPPLVRVEPAGVIVTALKPSEDGKAWIIRLFGASGKDETARLVWSKPVSVTYSDVVELVGQKAPESIPVSAWSLVTLRADRQ